MEKQVLTWERILQDYKDKMRSTLKSATRLLTFLICILIALVYLTIRILEDGFLFYVIWVDLVIVLWICVCIVGLIGHNKCYQNLKLGHFYVVTDELIGKQEQESYLVRYLKIFNKSAGLEFKTYGSFTITSLHTSDNPNPYVASDADNYICSSVGDKFLLGIDRKSHILLVYNKKLFEYCE